MSRNIFGWSLPPGVTSRMIDEACGAELPCETCGRGTDSCICPECPICGEAGNVYCYDENHLTYNTDQNIGRALFHIHELETQLDTERYVLETLLEQKERESSDNGSKA